MAATGVEAQFNFVPHSGPFARGAHVTVQAVARAPITSHELVHALRPDILVKGADYPRDRIVGADFVEARGGRVVRVPLLPETSTTRIMERLRATS